MRRKPDFLSNGRPFKMGFKNNGMPTDSAFWDSASLQANSFWYWYSYLLEVAMTRFEWKNLPDTVDERFLEMILISQGHALFFKDDVADAYRALQCTMSGTWDFYHIPPLRRAYAENGYNVVYNQDNSVLIYNNYLRTEGISPLVLFAQKLAKLDVTVDINVNSQKTPILLLCPENQRLTLKNLYMQYDGGSPVIFGDKDLNVEESVKVLQTGAPFIAPDLIAVRNQILQDAMGYLGILTQTGFKRERQTAEEIVQNNANVISRRFSPLLMRQKACDEINAMFGSNIEVDFREDMGLIEEWKEATMQQQSGNNFNNPERGGDIE